MAKTHEELIQIKEEYDSLNNKLKELSEDELKQVTGGERENNILLYEESFDQVTGGHSGSIQDVIGDWDIEEH